jgi:hypothetical protein
MAVFAPARRCSSSSESISVVPSGSFGAEAATGAGSLLGGLLLGLRLGRRLGDGLVARLRLGGGGRTQGVGHLLRGRVVWKLLGR